MLKKISYIVLIVLILIALVGLFAIRYFNTAFFKERPNYLTYNHDSKPIGFQWSNDSLVNYIEPHSAIVIPVKIEGLTHKFFLQFDTGAQSTIIYRNTLNSLKNIKVDFEEVSKDDELYIEKLDFSLGGCKVNAAMIKILEGYGNSFDKNDTIVNIQLGTLGADFLDQHITVIDFKNKIIQLYEERPKWMSSLPNFKPFDFKGRRFILPAKIDGVLFELLYDSGSSAFGLITTKNRYDQYYQNSIEIKYEANSWENTLPIKHSSTNKKIELGNAKLDLKRISYVDMYANYQRFITPFTSIGGWLGNKPFTETIMILDTKNQEFSIIENSIEYK